MNEDEAPLVVLPEGSEIERADKLRELEDILKTADENREAALSTNTRKAYASQWRAFAQWCESMGLPLVPTDNRVLLAYLTDRQRKGASVSTLGQAYAAIREENRNLGHEPPALDGQLKRSWLGARKTASRGRKVDKALALSGEYLKTTLGACGGPLGPRDQALLLVGWCGAMRSEEIVNLDLGDIEVREAGLRVTIRQSKTDQMGAGHEIGIHRADDGDFCPVGAWEDYLQEHPAEGVEDAPAFLSRTGHRLSPVDVDRVLKRRMKQSGLNPKGYSSHSLRAGCITAAAEAGFSLEAIQRQSRHKTVEVLLGYIRTATLFRGNVTEKLL